MVHIPRLLLSFFQDAGYVTIGQLHWHRTLSVPEVNEALWWTAQQQYFLLPSWVFHTVLRPMLQIEFWPPCVAAYKTLSPSLFLFFCTRTPTASCFLQWFFDDLCFGYLDWVLHPQISTNLCACGMMRGEHICQRCLCCWFIYFFIFLLPPAKLAAWWCNRSAGCSSSLGVWGRGGGAIWISLSPLKMYRLQNKRWIHSCAIWSAESTRWSCTCLCMSVPGSHRKCHHVL